MSKPSPPEVERLQQGCLYQHKITGRMVLALSSGTISEALVLDMREPSGYSGREMIYAAHVEAMPMKYYGGRVP